MYIGLFFLIGFVIICVFLVYNYIHNNQKIRNNDLLMSFYKERNEFKFRNIYNSLIDYNIFELKEEINEQVISDMIFDKFQIRISEEEMLEIFVFLMLKTISELCVNIETLENEINETVENQENSTFDSENVLLEFKSRTNEIFKKYVDFTHIYNTYKIGFLYYENKELDKSFEHLKSKIKEIENIISFGDNNYIMYPNICNFGYFDINSYVYTTNNQKKTIGQLKKGDCVIGYGNSVCKITDIQTYTPPPSQKCYNINNYIIISKFQLINTMTGLKSIGGGDDIQPLKIGDKILFYDNETKIYIPTDIKSIRTIYKSECIRLKYNNSPSILVNNFPCVDYQYKGLYTFIKQKGELSCPSEKEQRLEINDILIVNNILEQIVGTKKTEELIYWVSTTSPCVS
jgi:hypothetical protein